MKWSKMNQNGKNKMEQNWIKWNENSKEYRNVKNGINWNKMEKNESKFNTIR